MSVALLPQRYHGALAEAQQPTVAEHRDRGSNSLLDCCSLEVDGWTLIALEVKEEIAPLMAVLPAVQNAERHELGSHNSGVELDVLDSGPFVV